MTTVAVTDQVRLDDYFLPREIGLQPAVVRRVLEVVDPLLPAIAADIAARGIRDIVMTGCGDSLFSPMAAAFAFIRYAGRMSAPMHALEYSRGFYRASGPRTLVCALSYSGETRRVLEAATAARNRGALLAAITVDDEGSIARLADHVIPNASPIESERSNCRTGSYQAAYLALVLLAAHLGVAEGVTTTRELDKLRGRVLALADGIERSLDDAHEAGRAAATDLRGTRSVYFLGGGEAYAAALYACAKLYETSSLPAVPQEMEQFAHCEIFSLEPDSVAVVVALKGAFYSRAAEVADAIRLLGARVIGVSDNPSFAEHADRPIIVDTDGFTDLGHSLAIVPLQWMAFYDAVWRGQAPDLVRHKEVNSPLIRGVPIWTAEDYAAVEAVP